MISFFGLLSRIGPKILINHPELGNIQYLKTYLLLDEKDDPELFVCKFTNTEDKYIGRRVEEYKHPDLPKTLVHNYYFVGVNDSEIKLIEKEYKMLGQLFNTRPVWFLNYLRGWGDPISRWKKESKINPMYEDAE